MVFTITLRLPTRVSLIVLSKCDCEWANGKSKELLTMKRLHGALNSVATETHSTSLHCENAPILEAEFQKHKEPSDDQWLAGQDEIQVCLLLTPFLSDESKRDHCGRKENSGCLTMVLIYELPRSLGQLFQSLPPSQHCWPGRSDYGWSMCLFAIKLFAQIWTLSPYSLMQKITAVQGTCP